MDYSYLLKTHQKYGTTSEDILKRGDFYNILNDVVIAPWWDVSIFDNGANEIIKINDNLYNIINENYKFSYIQLKAIGAPVIMDTLMRLGVTKCKNIIFIGSVGSLCEDVKIGEVVIPSGSICGEGASRYLNDDLSDDFGKEFKPTNKFQIELINSSQRVCNKNNINFHVKKNYSVDTIFLQFAHIDYIKSLGAETIEMETSAFFKAANIIGSNAVALLLVSDNTVMKKGLYSGRNEEEQKYRKHVRNEIIPQIIYDFLSSR